MKELKKSTPLLDTLARSIGSDAKLISFARKRKQKIYEITSCDTTVEMTPNKAQADKVFNKISAGILWEINGRFKKKLDEKSYHKDAIKQVLNNLPQVG